MPSSTPTTTMLFDLDGTLVDSLGDIAASVNHVRALAGLDSAPLEEVRYMLGDGARVLVERAIAGNPRGVAPTDVWQDYREHHAVQCTELVTLYDGVVAHLDRWRDADRTLGVVTNKPEAFAVRILEHLGIADRFATVIGGDTTPERKPAPEPVLEALRRLDRTPAEAVMIGDGPQDIRAGRAAGTRTVGVLFGFRDEPDVRAEGADEYWTRFGVPE